MANKNRIKQIKMEMLSDIYMEGVNMAGEYHGCWVRFNDIESIVERYFKEVEYGFWCKKSNITFIKDYYKENNMEGAVIGISVGKDPAANVLNIFRKA